MANWALVIGINKYDRLRSLDYAERDAELMQDFFQNEAGFEQVFFFSDSSPEIVAPDGSVQSTRPTYANLWSFLHDFFEYPCLQAGDNFWFFFSGHGIRHQERDYLMPCDANPRAVEHTAISISYVTERLRRCGADNVVLLLDACRNEGDKAGLGIGWEKHQGVITICSCSPREKSYEIEEIQQGTFTYALLESLRIQGEGNCATVERLYHRLRYRVAEINDYYKKPRQTPYAIAEPASKYHLILVPRQATLQDIATLREDAAEAELDQDFELAEQLWTRVLTVSPADPKALKALRRIWGQPRKPVSSSSPTATQDSKTKSKDTEFHQKPEPSPSALPTPEVIQGHIPRIDLEVEQCSERGIDYTHLRNLLTAKKWREADWETGSIILQATGREKRGYLNSSDFEKFPCADLCTLDQLWQDYSDGRFGFSIQKRIYEEEGKDYRKLAERVGWCVGGNWVSYAALTWHQDAAKTAPEGHLPVNIAGSWKAGPNALLQAKHTILFSRVQTCGLSEPESRITAQQQESLSASATSLIKLLQFESEVELCSEQEIDYTPLRDLLIAQKWKEADEETAKVMLKAAGREKRGWIDEEDIRKLSCTDLCTIDQLWVKYSKGHFGFSVQKQIWESIGGRSGHYDYETYTTFSNRVGWREKGGWIPYSNSTFTLNAPQGYLPFFVGGGLVGWGWVLGGVWSLFARIETCDV